MPAYYNEIEPFAADCAPGAGAWRRWQDLMAGAYERLSASGSGR